MKALPRLFWFAVQGACLSLLLVVLLFAATGGQSSPPRLHVAPSPASPRDALLHDLEQAQARDLVSGGAR